MTEKQTCDYRDGFKLFDRDADGFIDHTEVGLVLRSLGSPAAFCIVSLLGMTPTDNDIKRIETECAENSRTNIDFTEVALL